VNDVAPTAISRRKVLKYSALSAALAAAGIGIVYSRATSMDVVVAVLKRRLDPLGLDVSYALFAAQYVEFRAEFRDKLRMLGSLAWFFRIGSPYEWLPMNHPLRRMEDNIVSNFMLSTDYFEHGKAEGRQIRYVGWHDPYERPCRKFFGD
jgi:hypothetical protein